MLDNRIRMMLAVGGLAACASIATACSGGNGGGPTPTTTTQTTSTTAPASTSVPSPTEKSIDPTGGNLFTPPVKATPAPNVPPGEHHGLNGIP
jgi:hypothetical protein